MYFQGFLFYTPKNFYFGHLHYVREMTLISQRIVWCMYVLTETQVWRKNTRKMKMGSKKTWGGEIGGSISIWKETRRGPNIDHKYTRLTTENSWSVLFLYVCDNEPTCELLIVSTVSVRMWYWTHVWTLCLTHSHSHIHQFLFSIQVRCAHI